MNLLRLDESLHPPNVPTKWCEVDHFIYFFFLGMSRNEKIDIEREREIIHTCHLGEPLIWFVVELVIGSLNTLFVLEPSTSYNERLVLDTLGGDSDAMFDDDCDVDDQCVAGKKYFNVPVWASTENHLYCHPVHANCQRNRGKEE